VYVRNQRLKASQSNTPAPIWEIWAGMAVHTPEFCSAVTLWSVIFAGQEATRKACGVLVAMLQGHSWAPTPPTGAW
jgi:hypothetical protein